MMSYIFQNFSDVSYKFIPILEHFLVQLRFTVVGVIPPFSMLSESATFSPQLSIDVCTEYSLYIYLNGNLT